MGQHHESSEQRLGELRATRDAGHHGFVVHLALAGVGAAYSPRRQDAVRWVGEDEVRFSTFQSAVIALLVASVPDDAGLEKICFT